VIGKLTGGVAHDFNNMLTVIAGTTETLVAGHERPAGAAAHRFADRRGGAALHRADPASAGVCAGGSRLHPRNVEVNATIADVAKLMRPTLGEQIEITTMLDPEVSFSHVDPSKLANSVLNMRSTPATRLPAGGKLLLETRNVELDAAYAQANPDVRPGRYIMLAVSDTGTGMPQHVQDKAFEPVLHHQGDRQGEADSGCRWSMASSSSRADTSGSTARKVLAARSAVFAPALGQVEAAAMPVATISQGTETILVVEDDTLVRNFVTAQLPKSRLQTSAPPTARPHWHWSGTARPLISCSPMSSCPAAMTGRQLADEGSKSSGRSEGALYLRAIPIARSRSTPPRRWRAAVAKTHTARAQLAQMVVRQALGG